LDSVPDASLGLKGLGGKKFYVLYVTGNFPERILIMATAGGQAGGSGIRSLADARTPNPPAEQSEGRAGFKLWVQHGRAGLRGERPVCSEIYRKEVALSFSDNHDRRLAGSQTVWFIAVTD
jgi:hypothetical protein